MRDLPIPISGPVILATLIRGRDQRAPRPTFAEDADTMVCYPAAQAFLDRHVLQYMHGNSGGRGSDWTAFYLRCFVNDWITKDMARAICRSLTVRGYACYERRLWTEDGETAGAGYRITEAGREYLKQIA